jgi:putative transport protein
MEWLAAQLREHPELALFLSLALGQVVGRVRLGSFTLGAVVGTLLAGLAVGQVGIQIPSAMRSVFLVMFLFAIGLRTGPEFFRSLRSNLISQLGLSVLLCIVTFAVAWGVARVFQFDSGTAAGMLAGGGTNSTALGTASAATTELAVDPAIKTQLLNNLATTYALTYVFGALLVAWFLPVVGPVLMRVNLRQVCRELEEATSKDHQGHAVNVAYRAITVRAYRLPAALDGHTVTQVEGLWPLDRRVVITRIRRGTELVDPSLSLRLQSGDLLGVAGRVQAFADQVNPFDDEVDDRDLVDMPTIAADLVLRNRGSDGQPLGTLVRNIGPRGVFLLGLKRGGRSLPYALSTVLERGDVLSITGIKTEIERVANEIGFAVYPTANTDLLLVAVTIVLGGFIGLPALMVGSAPLALSVPAGVLVAGFVLGHLRSIYPQFARIPDASSQLLESFGMTGFVALVGLQAGPEAIDSFRRSGLLLVTAATLVALVPHLVTILVGRYIVGLHPGVLLGVCAGAGTATPALAATERAADSRVPTLGYGMASAVGNVLMAISGTLIVLTSGR